MRQMLNDWTKAAKVAQGDDDIEYFRLFVDWCRCYDIAQPATGQDVAEFMTEMLFNGCTIDQIRAAAWAIVREYKHRRRFLDHLAIEGALAMCKAQLSPGRVLN